MPNRLSLAAPCGEFKVDIRDVRSIRNLPPCKQYILGRFARERKIWTDVQARTMGVPALLGYANLPPDPEALTVRRDMGLPDIPEEVRTGIAQPVNCAAYSQAIHDGLGIN